MSTVSVEFFTHPVCTGCWDVGQMLQQLSADLPRLMDLTQWSLADKAGRARAEALGVMEVPTVIIGGRERIVGVPDDIAVLKGQVLKCWTARPDPLPGEA